MNATRTLSGILTGLGACKPAIDWAETQDDPEMAWNTCDRADWLLWIAAKLGINCLLIATATTLILKHVKPDEERMVKAITTIEAWSRGNATIDQVLRAKHAADDANAEDEAYAAYAADATRQAAIDTTNAANATAIAGNNEALAAYAADATRAAAAATADAANAVAAATARKEALKHRADLVRQVIKFENVKSLIPKS